MKMSSGLERFVDIVCEVLAFLTVMLIVLLYINRYVGHLNGSSGFLPSNAANLMESIREIAILVVVGLAGLQFALKRGFIIFLIYAVLVAAAVIFMFFPGVLPVSVGANQILSVASLC